MLFAPVGEERTSCHAPAVARCWVATAVATAVIAGRCTWPPRHAAPPAPQSRPRCAGRLRGKAGGGKHPPRQHRLDPLKGEEAIEPRDRVRHPCVKFGPASGHRRTSDSEACTLGGFSGGIVFGGLFSNRRSVCTLQRGQRPPISMSGGGKKPAFIM